jgi:nucleoside-diphosphate-sugar epimerase
MKLVVTGATGNIGTQLLELCSEDERITEVIAIQRRTPERSWAKTRFVSLDVAGADLSGHFRGADAVVHLAWIFQPTHRPLETWRVNVGGSANVLRTALAEGVPALVCASSVGAYSPGRAREVDENWATDGLPTAGYGREKAYVERLLDALEARRPEMRVVRMRPGFVFQASAATEQRRLFGGPLVPASLLAPGRLPALPFPDGLRFQALHARDAARAFLLAVTGDVRGAFNLAAAPPVDGPAIAGLLGARLLPVPPALVRSALAAAWLAHLVPVEPALFDLAMGLPIMKTERAREVLSWAPEVTAMDAIAEALRSMSEGTGGETPPLAADSASSRLRELAGGVGRSQ